MTRLWGALSRVSFPLSALPPPVSFRAERGTLPFYIPNHDTFYRFMPNILLKARFLGGLGMIVRGEYVLFEMQT